MHAGHGGGGQGGEARESPFKHHGPTVPLNRAHGLDRGRQGGDVHLHLAVAVDGHGARLLVVGVAPVHGSARVARRGLTRAWQAVQAQLQVRAQHDLVAHHAHADQLLQQAVGGVCDGDVLAAA